MSFPHSPYCACSECLKNKCLLKRNTLVAGLGDEEDSFDYESEDDESEFELDDSYDDEESLDDTGIDDSIDDEYVDESGDEELVIDDEELPETEDDMAIDSSEDDLTTEDLDTEYSEDFSEEADDTGESEASGDEEETDEEAEVTASPPSREEAEASGGSGISFSDVMSAVKTGVATTAGVLTAVAAVKNLVAPGSKATPAQVNAAKAKAIIAARSAGQVTPGLASESGSSKFLPVVMLGAAALIGLYLAYGSKKR